MNSQTQRSTWRKHVERIVILGSIALYATVPVHAQQQCDAKAFNNLIDETAQTLRTLNKDSERRFQERLQSIAKAKGWSQSIVSTKAAEATDDKRLGNFNNDIEQLVSKLDALSSTNSGDLNCQRLTEIKTVRDRLVTVMGQKAGFILAQLDNNPSAVPVPKPVAEDISQKPVILKSEATSQPVSPSSASPQPTPVAADPTPMPKKPQSEWAANLAKVPTTNPKIPPVSNTSNSAYMPPTPLTPPPPSVTSTTLPPLSIRPQPQTHDQQASLRPQDAPPITPYPNASTSSNFTAEEIRNAGQGIFGTLTADLAGVVNYAFSKYGQPNGYIIGNEGGGAFLAGLRYGDGQLFTRINGADTGPTRIYWQGPSVGIDVGATGSKTLFLVYNLQDTERLYERFPGLDGSAYVAGGIGLTVYKQGNIVIIPIRTGLGLRLGASIAYLKFTPKASWNPF